MIGDLYQPYHVPATDYIHEKIKFITEYVMNSLHTGTSVIDLVKEAKEAWQEIIKQ